MVKFDLTYLSDEVAGAVCEVADDLGVGVGTDGLTLKLNGRECGKNENVAKVDDCCVIECAKKSEFFRLLGIVVANGAKKGFYYSEKPKADNLGFMTDCSRNAVQNPETLKRLIRILAVLGYNSLHLYTEDTYEIEGEPFFGYMRGRYSSEEIKALDRYADAFGIEIIPCIQTLAHLNCICRWKYNDMFDCNDILLVDDDRTYTLIDKMLKTVSGNFTTKKVNIGMDEAYMLGRGKYLDKNGYVDRGELMLRHLKKVLDIAKKYDLQPMMWSDMFFPGDYYGDAKPSKKQREDMPDVDLIYWDYYHLDKKDYDRCIKKHLAVTDKVWFAGGAWKWRGFVPLNKYSILATEAALSAVYENGVKNVFITGWGDNGGECSVFAVLPVLARAAELSYDCSLKVKNAFDVLTGLTESEFMSLDLPNVVGPIKEANPHNPSKYGFYNDPFLRIYDSTIRPGDGKLFADYASILKKAASKKGPFSYLFRTIEKLCSVLELKYELGLKTERAYFSRNEKELRGLIDVYSETIKRTENFLNFYRKQWFKENKAFGFEIQEIRIGGLIARLKSCKQRIKVYIEREVDRIEELEEKVLDLGGKTEGYTQTQMTSCSYDDIVSPASKLPLF